MPFADPEVRKEYDRQRSKDPKRREFSRQWQKDHRKRANELRNTWLKNNPGKVAEYRRNYMKNNKDKEDARVFSRLAVKFGYLEKESCHCGSEESQIHHSDYTDPLNVKWLCREHHLEEHGGSFR